jgi:vacuolar-type H+-ATPase catalytic subunit A/Vma1
MAEALRTLAARMGEQPPDKALPKIMAIEDKAT